jgi:hypothetical protein
MSHGHHAHHGDNQHTEHNPKPAPTEAELAAQAKKEAADKKKEEAQAKREAAQKERDEKKAKRDAERAEANAKKEAERTEKAQKRDAERAEKNAEREKQKEADKETKKAEREAAKETKKAERAEANEQKKAEREQQKEAAKEARKQDVAYRAQALSDRKAATKTDGQRRTKATHVHLNESGLSNPQATSTRGKVLEHLRKNYEAGDLISIDDLAKDCKPVLYGASIRSFLSKLEEVGHVDFVTSEAEEKSDPAGSNDDGEGIQEAE